jgi:hypothetical protein
MELNSKRRQLFYYTLSSLLIAVIAVCSLKMNVNRSVNGCRWKSKISYQFNRFAAEKNSCFYTGSKLKSTPYAYDLVLKQVIDGEVYTPNKMQGKASNIKKNLSLARLTIVTA